LHAILVGGGEAVKPIDPAKAALLADVGEEPIRAYLNAHPHLDPGAVIHGLFVGVPFQQRPSVGEAREWALEQTDARAEAERLRADRAEKSANLWRWLTLLVAIAGVLVAIAGWLR
jgi:hypothetical protein